MRSFYCFGILILASLSLARPAAAQTSTQLVVDVRRIVNETATGDATLLFDEQTGGTNSIPTNKWTTVWSPDYYPVAAIVDLAGKCHLADITFFDFEGVDDLKVEALV